MAQQAPKESPAHSDLIGREIKPNSFVATPGYNRLVVMRVVELTPKMVRLASLNRSGITKLKYPHDTVVLDSSDVSMYLLQQK